MPDVVVIGAGISGLTCAWQLRREGLEVLVLESTTRPGGVIATHSVDGYLIEAGPNSILPTPGSSEIIERAGLSEQMLSAPSRSPRFIYLNGRLRKVPWVLSPGGFFRGLIEPLIPRAGHQGDESLESFFTRRFGRQVHDRLVSPFVGGIYAGDTKAISIRAAFPRLAEHEQVSRSVVLGMLRSRRSHARPVLSSFKGGMEALPRALARGLEVRYDVGEILIRRGWFVDFGGESVRASAIVAAVPAYAGTRVLRDVDSELGRLLSSVSYAPILVAASSIRRAADEPSLSGFGFLVPRTEGLRTLGTLFSSSLFPGRAPVGRALLTSFLGGVLDPEIVDWSDARVWETVNEELKRVLRFEGESRSLRLFRYERAIPQYKVGHAEWRESVRVRLEESPGLFLTGNYLDGVSVPMSMEQGRQTAYDVIEFVRRTS